jgi:hypothetical protein
MSEKIEPVAFMRHRVMSGAGGFGGGVVCEFSEQPFGGFDDPGAGDKEANIEPLFTTSDLELFGYWDEEYSCFVPREVAQGLIDLDSHRIRFLPLYRKVKA